MKNPFRKNLNIYRNYVCPNCFNQLNKCTCNIEQFPPYTLIQIDEGIQNIVRQLNNKGYYTKYSCESHFDYSYSIYIMFNTLYKFKTLPKDYVYKNSLLEYEIKNKDNEEVFNDEKRKYLKVLEDWVKTL